MSNRAAILMAAAFSMVSGRAALAECGMAMGSHGDHDAGDHDAVEGHHEAAPAYRSPGLAAVLSLTPLPVDFGNFYTDNVGWGVAYTALELGLAAPMMWLAADRGMGHGYSGSANGWSSGDRNAMLGLVSGYVVVKLVAGLHAAHNAEVFNHEHQSHGATATIVPANGGAMALASWRF